MHWILIMLLGFGSLAQESDSPVDPVGGDGPKGSLKFQITDTNDNPVPSRLTFRKQNGSRQKFFSETQVLPEDLAIRDDVICTLSGTGHITLPVGTWVIYASRGPEWGIDRQEVSIAEGAVTEASFQLEHQIDSSGWAAADYHLHTLTYSGHGDSNMTERIISIASEALEVGIATDHNHHTDYDPTIEKLSAGDHFQGVVGNEISVPLGHFNAFPLEPWGEVVDVQSSNGPRMFRAVRKMGTGGVTPVIQVNHPRWEAIDYFRIAGLDPITGESADTDWSIDFDSVEIFNENPGWGYYDAETSDRFVGTSRHSVLEDWHQLLNRGARITAVGNSDSHTVNVNLAGWPRNYFPVSNDQPGQIPVKEICDTVKNGQVFTTYGPFIKFSVNGKGMGETVQAERAAVRLKVEVHAADWIDVDRVLVIVDGDVVETIPVPDSREIVRLIDERKIPVRTDGWIAVRVEGDDSLAPIVPDKDRPILPIAMTNPVYVDVDGDGRVTAPVEVARNWLENFSGNEIELHAEWQARQPHQRVSMLHACDQDSETVRTLLLWGLQDPSRLVWLAAARTTELLEIRNDSALTRELVRRFESHGLDAWALSVLLRAMPPEESGPRVAELLGSKGKEALGIHTRQILTLLPGQFVRRMFVSEPIPGGGEEGIRRVLSMSAEDRPTQRVLLSTEEGQFDLQQYGKERGQSDDCVFVLRCTLISPTDRTVTLAAGSDDGCLLQVNGNTIVEDFADQGVDPLDHLIQVPLKQGTNEVLFLIANGSGKSGASLRILDDEVVVQSAGGSKRPPISPRQRVLSDMAALHAAATLYRLNQGNWPTSVRDLVEANLIGNLTADPWGGEYQIVPKEEKVEILSLGADGSEGGIGIEADIRYAP